MTSTRQIHTFNQHKAKPCHNNPLTNFVRQQLRTPCESCIQGIEGTMAELDSTIESTNPLNQCRHYLEYTRSVYNQG